MKLWRFYIVHSLRDLYRNRMRTLFALICVATGVAAVVALRSLAFMISDELTTNLAQINRGDIRVFASRDVPGLATLSPNGDAVFTPEGIAVLEAWARENDYEMQGGRLSLLIPIRRVTQGAYERPQPVTALGIEPDHYPFYDSISLRAPEGTELAAAFSTASSPQRAAIDLLLPRLTAVGMLAGSPLEVWAGQMVVPAHYATHIHSIVISANLTRASSLGLKVGDVVRLGATPILFRVDGVVPATAESILTVPQTVFFEYIYVPLDDLLSAGQVAAPDQVFFKLPLGSNIQAAEMDLRRFLSREVDDPAFNADDLNLATVPELEEDSNETASVIEDLILVMGLSSLLIGGIGIINTMLVVVSRRTVEVAVLKTLGLKGGRVTVLFLVEAIMMGLLGSVLGVVLGVALSYVIKGVGEQTSYLTLTWRLYPSAMMSGVFLGVVVTALFGFLPTLIAGQVRPAIVLRPNEAQLPTAGLLQMMVTLLVMIAVLGLLVNSIVRDAVYISPVLMLMGAGGLVGLFGGVIAGNTRVGKPLPVTYQFRLARRYERLEDILTGTAGLLAGWVVRPGREDLSQAERGRRVITLVVRGLRQAVLWYGAMAIGAALASGILWLVSQLWVPFGAGSTRPPLHILAAMDAGDVVWAVTWLALVLGVGIAIRLLARQLVGTIALGSLGASLGLLLGWVAAMALESPGRSTVLWRWMEDIAPGMVIVEGALTLLGTIFVAYWLMVWLVGRLPVPVLLAVIGAVLVMLVATVGVILAMGGATVQAGVIVGGVLVVGLAGYWWQRSSAREVTSPPAQRESRSGGVPTLSRWRSVLWGALAAGLLITAGYVLSVADGDLAVWGAGAVLALAAVGVWRLLRRRYTVDGRLVLREMSGRRGRVASTLLGLSIGVAGLSLVSLTTGSASQLLEVQLSENVEGNLLVVARQPDQGPEIREALDGTVGVEDYTQYETYQAQLVAVNGSPVDWGRLRDGEEAHDEALEDSNFENPDEGLSMQISVRGEIEELPAYRMVSGRMLDADDVGKPRIVLRNTFLVQQLEIQTGDRLMMQFVNGAGEADDVHVRLTVVGIIDLNSEQAGFGDNYLVAPGTLPGTVRAQNLLTLVTVDESDDRFMDNTQLALSEIPGVLVVELGALTQLITRLLDQLRAIPSLVAWLALVAGTAIIANTVALATQERRRQIGVMKAVGLKGWRVLVLLMAENGLIGLVAGLIGNAIGLIATVLLVLAARQTDELMRFLDVRTLGGLLLMSIGVAVGAAALTAWTAASEKPMNVLRYE